MTSESGPRFDIAIIGRGVRDVAHLTLESLEVLNSCKLGFVSVPTQEEVDVFRDSILKQFKTIESLPPLLTLSVAYRKDRSRTDNYADAGEVVLNAAKVQNPVAYLTPGNPVVWDAVTQRILEGSRLRGLRTKIVPGISFIDTMLADLEQEMAPGFQVYDASWVVGAEMQPDARTACVLVQIGLFCKNYPGIDTMPRATGLEVLRDYLLKFYPRDHLIVLVRSRTGGPTEPFVRPLALGELATVPGDCQLGASLYIPPLLEAALAEEFAARISKVETVKPRSGLGG
jgi:uncharacterized protein YabN with tetrapyrrole methylase and pyrophosphatase domain